MPSKNSESSSSTPPATQRRHPHFGIPLSLRRAPPQRKPSTPHLSVVFADPSLSHGGAAPSRPGTLASEDALARQMNAGGQEIGLRSRRSSSATVRTIRTLSGVGSPGVEEEGEAGPSTPRRTASSEIRDIPDEAVEAGLGSERRLSEENVTETSQRLNPKHSTSWLRWNAPSGFPKSRTGSMVGRDKGKGKERETGVTVMATPPATDGDSSSEDPSQMNYVSSSDSTTSVPPPNPPAVDPVSEPPNPSPPSTIRPAARTYRKNWWSRTASPSPSIRSPLPPDPRDHIAEEGASASPVDPPSDPPSANPDATQPDPTTPASVENPSQPAAAALIAATTSQPPIPAAGNGGGWKSYIWGNPSAPPLPPGEFTSDDHTAPLVSDPISTTPAQSESPATTIAPPSDLPLHPSVPSPKDITFPQNPEALPSDQRPPDAANTAAQQGSGWGTFLYSLVVPQIAVARSLESASALANQPGAYPAETAPPASTEISVDPAQDQRPEPAVKSTIPGLPNTPTTTSPLSTHSDALIVPSVPDSELPPGAALRKASTSSTTGWLSYLAYRSTQKKIGNGSVKSGRHSSELGEEEVMDFSVDPDFPSDPAVAEGKKVDPAVVPGSGAASDKDKMPPPKTIPNKSSSANLAVRGKRQSVSSVRSGGMGGGALTPLSSSPKTASMLDPKSTPTSSPRPASIVSSALPAPPLVPTQQPNLVIPTFENTFSRPPRSFLPLPPPTPEPATDTGSSGLAWRALSAAGSYVYTATAEKGKGKEKVGDEEEKKETRGRKEGRVVGADLPRRLGLGGGDSDEGWKNVKRVVVVGVHGWFPAKMLNSVIGEPTGTSQKFANMMGAAVKQFFAEQGMEEDIRLTLMPLEGEGTIDARVDKLYKAYLSNPAWINDLRRADAIFFAAHSQGCIVTTHLLSRMIAQGHIRTPFNTDAVGRCEWAFGPIGVVPPDSRRRSPLSPLKSTNLPLPGSEGGYQKVCMLAMCGVHLGPLYSISTSNVIQPYLQWFENAAARELFEFQESGSAVSLAYQKALGMVLDNGVKVVLLASLNDQVVPIYGSSFSTATHPLLLRALFVDGGSYSQTDFMTNLLCFAFMLRNAGLDDQRLIEHLSEATAGSLTGIGHSSPYEEPQSYALAVKYLFLSGPAIPFSPSTQTPSSPGSMNTPIIPPLRVEPFSARDTRNEFELPWIMRALVDSPQVKDLFPGELRELKEGVGAWRPVTKVLKEVKRRLEPMAGRQSRLRPIPNSPSSTSLNTVGSSGSAGREATLGGLKRDW